jgi:hypothetical protein
MNNHDTSKIRQEKISQPLHAVLCFDLLDNIYIKYNLLLNNTYDK